MRESILPPPTKKKQQKFRFLNYLAPTPQYSAQPLGAFRFLGCSSRIRHQNTLTEKPWEVTVQRLGKVLGSELFRRYLTVLVCVHLSAKVTRHHPPAAL